MIKEHSFYDLNPFKLIEARFRAQNIISSISVNVPRHLPCLYSWKERLVCRVLSKCQVKFVDSAVDVFCIFADYQPTFTITQKEVMKYPSIIVGFSIFPCSCVFCFIYFEAFIRCRDI